MKVIALPCRWAISLHAVLHHHVPVGHGQRVGIAHVDLFLPGPHSPLEFSTGMPRPASAVAHRAHHAFFLGGLKMW
jgi:hypothetical protein